MSERFVSYSQNGEDVVLWRALKHLQSGFYVDIGAGWARHHSVTKAFSLRGWTGINVDPNPAFHADLLADRPKDISLCLGLNDRHEFIPFMVIEDTGLSTFDPAVAEDHRNRGWKIRKIETETITLAELLTQYVPDGQDIHFLKIDAEGFEARIIGSNNWAVYRPWIVVCESTAPLSVIQTHEGFEKTLLEADYVFALFDGLNRYYVASEHRKLLDRLNAPANPLDDFVTFELKEARDRLDEQASELARVRGELSVANRLIEGTQQELADMRRYLKRAGEELNFSKHQLEQVYQSMSWKLTRPVRGAKLALLSGRRQLAALVRQTALHTTLKKAYFRRHTKNNPSMRGDTLAYYDLGDFVLAFDKTPCVDQRGIGRVANALSSALDAMAPLTFKPGPDKPVVYFFPSIHWLPDELPRPNVVMIHDVIPLIFPQAFPVGVVNEWKGKFADLARAADKVLTISNSSADSISESLGIERSNIAVNYNGVSAGKAELEDAILLPPQRFFCILGSADYHKNFQIVFEAFKDQRLADFHLVVIGEGEAYQRLVADHPAKERIHLLNRVRDGTVFEVLRRAEALLFPSLYEGFGLPPFEAALQGTPAICSRRPAMDELFSDECLFVPHDQPSAWSEAMLKLAFTPGMRSELAKKAAQRAKNFSWKKSAVHLIEICRQHSLATKPQK